MGYPALCMDENIVSSTRKSTIGGQCLDYQLSHLLGSLCPIWECLSSSSSSATNSRFFLMQTLASSSDSSSGWIPSTHQADPDWWPGSHVGSEPAACAVCLTNKIISALASATLPFLHPLKPVSPPCWPQTSDVMGTPPGPSSSMDALLPDNHTSNSSLSLLGCRRLSEASADHTCPPELMKLPLSRL